MLSSPPITPLRGLLRGLAELVPGGTVRLSNPLVHTNAGDLSRSFRRRQFWRNAAVHEPQAPIAIGRYPHAYVTGTHPHILISDGQIAAEYIPTNYSSDDLARRVAEMHDAWGHPIVIDEPVLYAAYPGLRIWGHWLVDMLPRVVLAERMWPGRFRYVLSSDLAPRAAPFFNAQVAASLAAYAISPERVLPIEPGHLYCFRNLYDFTGMPCTAHAVHPALLHIMRKIPSLPPPGRRLPFTAILRGSAEQRGLSNHSAITSVVERHGAGLLDPNTAPFAAQVMAFRDSDMIVGEMGSNLTGVIFARPGTGVISLAPCGWDDGFLARLLQMIDAMHADLRGPSTASTHDAMRTASYSVDPAAVEAGIAAMRTHMADRTPGDAACVDGRIVARRMGEALLEIGFAEGGNAGAFSPRGFSYPEITGRWSDGPDSTLKLHGFSPPADGIWLEIDGIGHETPPVLIDTEVAVAVNGQALARFDVGHVTRLQVPVPGALAASRTPIEITFSHASCPPFGSVTPSDDMRRLGFFYQRLRIRRRVP